MRENGPTSTLQGTAGFGTSLVAIHQCIFQQSMMIEPSFNVVIILPVAMNPAVPSEYSDIEKELCWLLLMLKDFAVDFDRELQGV